MLYNGNNSEDLRDLFSTAPQTLQGNHGLYVVQLKSTLIHV